MEARSIEAMALVIGQAMRMAAAGICVGLAAELGLARLIARLLFEVARGDPAAFAGAGVLLVAAALAASGVPAWRAARADWLVAFIRE